MSSETNKVNTNSLIDRIQQQLAKGSGGAVATASSTFSNHQGVAAPASGTRSGSSALSSLTNARDHSSANLESQARGIEQAGGDRHKQLSDLLASAKLLQSVNPALAAAVMQHYEALQAPPSLVTASNQGSNQKADTPPNLPSFSSGISSLSHDQSVSASSLCPKSNPSGTNAHLKSPAPQAENMSSNTGDTKNIQGTKRASNGSAKVTFSQGQISESLQFAVPAVAAAASSRSLDGIDRNLVSRGGTSESASSGTCVHSPPPLESLLEDAQKKEKRRDEKRLANRKSTSDSRDHKQKLIEELTAANSKLRRQVLVLCYLPDAIVALARDGKIKFCSPQLARILGHRMEDLEGGNIEEFIAPGSKGKVQRLIQNLMSIAAAATGREMSGDETFESRDPNASGDSSNGVNAVSNTSEPSFPMLEVQVDGKKGSSGGENTNGLSSDQSSERNGNDAAKLKYSTTTMSSVTQKSLTSSNENSATEESNEPPIKKHKADITKNKSATSSPEAMDVDDVMGDPVTANNQDAKLSSLMHRTRDGSKDSKDSIESTKDNSSQPNESQQHPPSIRRHVCNTTNPPEKQKDSVDSGYRNSSEGSEDLDNTSSNSGSSDSLKKKGAKRRRPLAPACTLWLIRSDSTAILCEATSSIRTRNPNDFDSELGMIDYIPNPYEPQEEEETEFLLCFRPLSEGARVDEESPSDGGSNEADGTNESEEATSDNPSSETEEGKFVKGR